MSSSTYVLITGGNRGLGEALVTRFLAQPNRTVIAANRDPNHPTSKALDLLPKGEGSRLIVVKYDAAVEQDAFDVAKTLQTDHGINHLDIVVANAGIFKSYPPVKDVKVEQILEHVQVNVFGVIWLFQATRELLKKSPNAPIFVPMTSGASSLTRQPPVPNAAYGPSKAMLNWFGVKINAEEEWLNTFLLDPGFVQTESANSAARQFGMEKATLPVDEATDGLFRVITTSTKERDGGNMVFYTGEVLTW
ncbi:hypothetical protein QBC47DRAFT_393954 [Echria macrotheca]|uniref:Uncharacterized protein n=1 Tax=Echria macrotheca TaxID=438768 RepID=A0AAJ0B6Q3_9PEZI|nr:hypothetical protein QBC47DRAFT_393954 [Echria macrotheca]